MDIVLLVLIGLLGASIGSFLSVVIYRVKNKKPGALFGRSMCPYCKKTLKWKYLIPILSFLMLGGKCGYCGKKISRYYFMLEILLASLFITGFLNFNFFDIKTFEINWNILENFIFFAVTGSLLAAIFFYDLLYREIPDRFSIPAIVVGAIWTLSFNIHSLNSVLIALGIIILFFGGQIVLSKGRWLGGGDLRVGAIMAVLLGAEQLVLALIIAYFIGALYSLPLIMSGKATGKTAIPFGPFLIIATFVSMFLGEELVRFYLTTVLG